MSCDPESTYDEIEEMFAVDPTGTTNAVIAEAAAIAAAEIVHHKSDHREQEFQKVLAGQTESAALTAFESLEKQHGSSEWNRVRPWVEKKLQESPHLIPNDALVSPAALTAALEDTFQLARREADEEEVRNHWEGVKAAKSGPFYVGNLPGARDDG